MDITPFENGVHSLAIGLGDLKRFLDNPKDQFALKSSIISIHHGIETLLKDVLFKNNPVFVLGATGTIKQVIDCYKKFYEGRNHYLFDDEFTINPLEALRRAKELNIGEINDRDYAAIKNSYESLNTIRNQLQHFAVKCDPQSVIKIFGELVPKAVKYISSCYQAINQSGYGRLIPHRPLAGTEHLFRFGGAVIPQLQKFNPEAPALIDLLQSKYDIMLKEALDKLKGTLSVAVPQSLEIVSHGSIGAPPYYPDIKLEGWISTDLRAHENALDGSFSGWEPKSAYYTAGVKIEPAIVLAEVTEWDPCPFEQSLTVTAEVSIEQISQLVSIDGLQEYLEFLRNPKLLLNIALTYKAQCRMGGHVGIDELHSIQGELNFALVSGIFGDAEGAKKIEILQAITLDQKNTRIEMHGWGKITDHYTDRHMLTLKIQGQGDLTVKQYT